ncbi:MAG: sugar-binding protein [Spirochaetota bacterium]
MEQVIRTIIAAALCTGAAFTQTIKAGNAAAIVLDGKLDEASWQSAPSSGAFRWLKIREKPSAPVKTEFRVITDSTAVYIGIRLDEPEMAKLKAATFGRDNMGTFSQDLVELFFDPEGKGNTYYQYAISAGGDLWDGYFIEKGNTTIGEYTGNWEAAVHKDDTFWSVEVRIPLSALYYTDAKNFGTTWKLNLCRERQTVPELSTWSSLVKGFHEPDNFQAASGMPKKDAKHDIRITFMETILNGHDAGTYSGSLDMKITAFLHTAGTYSVEVKDEENTVIASHGITVSAGENRISVPNIRISRLGKQYLHTVLRISGGDIIADMFYPVRSEYTPLVIDITSPFYGNAVFPGQTVGAIEGSVTLNIAKEKAANARVEVSMGSARAPAVLRNGKYHFSLPGGIAEGDHTVAARAVGAGATLAEGSTVIRKLPPFPGSIAYIDKDLNFVLNGKPMFIRSWYNGGGTWMVSRAIRSAGNEGPITKHVNAWECIQNMQAERIDKAETPRTKLDVEPSQKIFDTLKKRIDDNRTNMNLLWYYLEDEPECRGVSPVYLRHLYRYIKKNDPYRPVQIITRAPELYTECADILAPHPYISPVIDANGVRRLSTPMKSIRDQLRTVASAGKGRIAPWLCQQAFSYEFQDPFAHNPNFIEYNCMFWSAVANGCKGFVPFTYCWSHNSMDLRMGTDFIYESLADLEPALLGGGDEILPATVRSDDDAVDVLVRRHKNTVLVVSANVLPKQAAVSVSCPKLGTTTLFGYREDGTVNVVNGSFTLSLGAYGTRILMNPKRGEGLQSTADFLKELDAANAALKRPGNILYGRGREIDYDSSDPYMGTKLYSLCDGITDAYGWANWSKPIKKDAPARLEMSFPNFTPKFKKLVIHTATIEDCSALIWKFGEWKSIGDVTGNKERTITFEMPEKTSTVKLQIITTKIKSGERCAEIYEVEMYE